MSTLCFHVEELEEIAGLDPGDSRLLHLTDCPRCRALLASYRVFREPGTVPTPAGADLSDAERRLSAALQRGIHDTVVTPEKPMHRRDGPREGPLAWFLRGFRSPLLRPALAAAGAVCVLLFAVNLLDLREHGGHRGVLRGGEQAAGLVLQQPQIMDDGRVKLSWRPVEAADTYRVILYGIDLNEQARLEAGPDTFLVFRPSDLPGLSGSGEPILWRVAAFRGGDEIGRSRPGHLELP